MTTMGYSGSDPSATVCAEMIEAVRAAEDVDGIHRVCSRLCREVGFDHFIYGAQFPVSLVRPRIVIISGYPAEWREHYDASGYLTADPTVHHCATRSTPVVWRDLAAAGRRRQKEARFWGEAGEYGLRSGVSFPIHGKSGEFGMLSLASTEPHFKMDAAIRRVLPIGQLLATYMHEASRAVFDQECLPIRYDGLTTRERECLLWTAEGKTAWEIGNILGISERTVVFHLKNVTEKLNVTNRAQAVARAVACGYIQPRLSR